MCVCHEGSGCVRGARGYEGGGCAQRAERELQAAVATAAPAAPLWLDAAEVTDSEADV